MNPANMAAEEIAKFEGADWWDPQGDFRPLHEINPLRLDYIAKRAPLAGKRVLDVGCGGGILTEAMASQGAEVTGIDLSQTALAVAKAHAAASQLTIDYRAISAEDLAAERPGRYDIVTCLEMLEHVPAPASVIDACARLVEPGGGVFFSTINRNPKAFVQAIIGAEYVLRLLPRGTHQYARFIRPAELTRWARQAGLAARDLTGLTYNPLTRIYRLTGAIEVNYLMHTSKK